MRDEMEYAKRMDDKQRLATLDRLSSEPMPGRNTYLKKTGKVNPVQALKIFGSYKLSSCKRGVVTTGPLLQSGRKYRELRQADI